MAVVKNLMVRVGADLSGFVSGMKKAGNAAGNFSKNFKKAMQESGSSMGSLKGAGSVTGYAVIVKQTQRANREAAQSAQRLEDKLKELEASYAKVQNATDGMDLSTPLTKQADEALRKWVKASDAVNKAREELKKFRASNYAKTDRADKISAMQNNLHHLTGASRAAQRDYERLNQAMSAVGKENIHYASIAGLKTLRSEITATRKELNATQSTVVETGAALRSMGVGVSVGQMLKAETGNLKAALSGILDAFRSAGADSAEGIRSIGRSIKSIPTSILHKVTRGVENLSNRIRQIPNIPGKVILGVKALGSAAVQTAGRGLKSVVARLQKIGSNCRSAESGVDKLKSTLKKIGLTHGALKLVSAVTGRLRFITSSYISENAALQSQVDSLKSSLGQALAPAINLVTNALSALMPYIVGVSNAIGNLITNLFGSGWTTVADGASAAASATASATAAQDAYNRSLAGFDEITKLDSGSASSSSGSSSTTAVAGTLPEWLTNLGSRIQTAIAADNWEGVGSAVADKLGEAVDTARVKLNNSKFTGKVQSLTDKVSSVINGFFADLTYSDETTRSIAWNTGALIGDAVTLGLETAHQFLTTVNFSTIGETVAQGINGALSSLSESDVSVGTLISNLINSGVQTAGGLIKNLDWSELGRSISQTIKDLIQNIDYSEIFSTLGSLLGGIGVSIWTIISDAITEVGDYFSKSIEDAGGAIGKGILNGIKKVLLNGVDWMLDNALIPFVEGLAEQFKDVPVLGDALNSALGGLNKFDVYIEGKLTDLDTSKVDGTSVSTNANLTTYTSSLKKTTIPATANLTTYTNSLNNATVSTRANLTTYTNSLNNATVPTMANLTTYTNSLNNATVPTRANLTTYTNSLNNATVPTRANLTTYTNSLNNATVPTRANLTTYTNSLNNATVSTRANLTTWQDSLSNKTLTFSANVTKGWSGDLAAKLGISTITSKLNVKTPTITANWATSTVSGQSLKYPTSFSLAYNAKGGILNGAQLFGLIGNTLQVGGEAGREALLPLDRNTGWMDKFSDKVARKVSGGQNSDQNITVQLVLDGKVITQTVVRNINATARATGRNPLAATM